jgi:branched-chain amino acid transport system ATP-binding protein
MLLQADKLTIEFGGLKAVSDFSLKLNEKELVGLIGPNGAGKTTIFNMLTGVYAPSNGTIALDGVFIQGKKTYEITQKNICRTFQNIRLFKNVTVLDNIKISFNFQAKYSLFHSIFRLPSFFKGENEIEKKSLELLEIFGLATKKDELASNLSYGEQRKFEIARALAANPKLLLLDEPAAGMNPQETLELMHLIKWIRDKFNIAILLIEHDMKLVMGLCEKILVVDYGKIIAEGTPEEIKNNPKVIKAYLGEESVSC